jgi:hypothetical protein
VLTFYLEKINTISINTSLSSLSTNLKTCRGSRQKKKHYREGEFADKPALSGLEAIPTEGTERAEAQH